MPLQYKYTSADEIPEAHRELFTETNGEHVFTGIPGIKTQADVDAVHTGLVKERNEHKATKAKYSGWTRLVNPETQAPFEKAEDLQAILDELPTLKAAAESGGSKSAEAVTKQVEAAKAALQTTMGRELTKANDSLAKAQARIETFEDNMRTDALRNAAMNAANDPNSKLGKMDPHAIEDMLLWAERHLEVDEERDEETGELTIKGVQTRDGVGVTPGVGVSVWLAEMQPRKGHWYLTSDGTGADGRRSSTVPGGGANPWTAANWNVTAQGNYFKTHGKEKAEQAARSAGTTVGGPPPKGTTTGIKPRVQPRRSHQGVGR